MLGQKDSVGIKENGFIERLAEKLGTTASAACIYGTPVERDGLTVIPVARVMYGLGGGSGHKDGEEGSGMGGGVMAKPVGYIEMKGGEARFCPIRNPLMTWSLIAGGGMLSLLALKAIFTPARGRRAGV
jgi:uncharacterized spore protein YtfJ